MGDKEGAEEETTSVEEETTSVEEEVEEGKIHDAGEL